VGCFFECRLCSLRSGTPSTAPELEYSWLSRFFRVHIDSYIFSTCICLYSSHIATARTQVHEEAAAAQLALERTADDQRQALHSQLHAQFTQLRHKHEFEAAQLALPVSSSSSASSASSSAAALSSSALGSSFIGSSSSSSPPLPVGTTPRTAAAVSHQTAASTSDRLLLSFRQQLETLHRQLHAREQELEQVCLGDIVHYALCII
jgi:hypothetical protein